MKNHIKLLALVTASALMFRAFDNEGGQWKKDADGKLAVDDKGNPIWVKTDNTEQSVQGDTIARLNGEAKSHRERAEAAEANLKKYTVNGKPLDPEAAAKAIETVGKLDAKKLIDAGEVDKVRDQVKAEFTTQLAEKDKAISDLTGNINGMMVDRVFDASEFARDRIAVPRDMFQAAFRQNFKVEDGKVVAYDRSGNRLLSKKNTGEYASPDEALELLVEAHPQKDAILKAQNSSGTGNNGNGGNRGGTGRVVKRADFERMQPNEQATFSQSVAKGEAQLVD